MKFGHTLQQRSIPQWAHHNIDYDGIKRLIKERTTQQNAAAPMSIAGHDTLSDSGLLLESDLLEILRDQLDHVALFTKTKNGEISRRLNHLARLSKKLGQRSSPGSRTTPIHQTRRYIQLVKDIEATGEDIQSLSRYVNTQRTGFRKLLKKHRKWTGSQRLEERFNAEVVGQRTGTLEPNLDTLLSQLVELHSGLLEMQRHEQGNEPTKTRKREQGWDERSESNIPSSETFLDQYLSQGRLLEFDAFFCKSSSKSSKARYWIPTENISEAHILLKRHMRSSTPTQSPTMSRHHSNTSFSHHDGAVGGAVTNAPSVGMPLHVALIDDAKTFIKDHTAANIGEIEKARTKSALHARLAAYWTEDEELDPLIDLRDLRIKDLPSLIYCQSKDVNRILSDCVCENHPVRETIKTSAVSFSQETKLLQDWLRSNPELCYLSSITLHRSRFQGIKNDPNQGLWAILDTQISVRLPRSLDRNLTNHVDSSSAEGRDFPHAILEIRWKGSQTPEIVRYLDESYLAERVRGFSLEAFAIYTLYSSVKAAAPVWLPLLEQDIRKLPPEQVPRRTRRDHFSLQPTPSASTANSSVDGPSDGAFSAQNAPSSATSFTEHQAEPTNGAAIQKPPQKPSYRRISRRKSTGNPPERYWNEFDDEENASYEAYTISVDPDAATSFPGIKAISSAFAKLNNLLAPNKYNDAEDAAARQPLLNKAHQVSPDQIPADETSSSSSDSDDAGRRPSRSRLRPLSHHHRIAARRLSPRIRKAAQRQARETALFRSSLGCFAASFALLLVTFALEATGRRKAYVQVDAGVIVGASAALVFGFLGVVLAGARREALGWAQRLALGLAGLVVLGLGAWELAVVVLGR